MQAWSAIIWRGVGDWELGRRRNMEKDEKKAQDNKKEEYVIADNVEVTHE